MLQQANIDRRVSTDITNETFSLVNNIVQYTAVPIGLVFYGLYKYLIKQPSITTFSFFQSKVSHRDRERQAELLRGYDLAWNERHQLLLSIQSATNTLLEDSKVISTQLERLTKAYPQEKSYADKLLQIRNEKNSLYKKNTNLLKKLEDEENTILDREYSNDELPEVTERIFNGNEELRRSIDQYTVSMYNEMNGFCNK